MSHDAWAEYRRLSQLFRETESEFCRFNRIPEAERRSQRRAVCALMFLDERLPLRNQLCLFPSSKGLGLIVDFESAALTREDVIYLRRCGVLLDPEDPVLNLCLTPPCSIDGN